MFFETQMFNYVILVVCINIFASIGFFKKKQALLRATFKAGILLTSPLLWLYCVCENVWKID